MAIGACADQSWGEARLPPGLEMWLGNLHVRHRALVKRFGIDISISGPRHGAVFNKGRLKRIAGFEPDPRFLVYVGCHFEATPLAILKLKKQGEIGLDRHIGYIEQHHSFPSLERVNPEWFDTLLCKFPMRQQFFTMQINPYLHHTQLPKRQFACKQRGVVDGDRSPVILVTNVNMGR